VYKTIEKIVEKPVEIIKIQYVEKRIEVPIVKEVEKIIEKVVYGEKIVEV
jgi:hypothetical protein